MTVTKNRARMLTAAGATLLLMTSTPAGAAREDTGTSSSTAPPAAAAATGQLSARDRELVGELYQAGNAEIEAGRVVAASASDLGVKKLGEQLVEDHTKANEELAKLAKEKGITLPQGTDEQQRQAIAELEKHKGTDFDRYFLDRMARHNHPDLQKLLDETAKTSTDPDLQKFAKGQIKVVGRHLEIARSVGHSAGNLSPSKEGTEPTFREPRAGTES